MASNGDYLSWRLVRLHSNQQWTEHSQGLCFVFPRGGMGNYNSTEASRSLAPGDVLLMNTSAQCRLTAPANREFEFGCFSLSVEHLFPLFSTNELCGLQSLCNTLLPGKWYPAAAPLASACHRLLDEIPPGFDLEHRVQLLKVAARLLSAEFEQAGPRPACIRANPHLANVLEKISANELICVPVQELARRSCCSRRHFTRLFHQHYGRSVKAIKMDLRLAKAACLLSDPNAKVTNVAEQCGFNHVGLFHLCFKRRFGSSPGQWRNLQASKQVASNGFPTGASGCALRLRGLCPWTANHNKPHSTNGARSIEIKNVPQLVPLPRAVARRLRKANFKRQSGRNGTPGTSAKKGS